MPSRLALLRELPEEAASMIVFDLTIVERFKES